MRNAGKGSGDYFKELKGKKLLGKISLVILLLGFLVFLVFYVWNKYEMYIEPATDFLY